MDNLNTNTVDSNTTENSDSSDSDDFINLEDLMDKKVENIYQLQINNQIIRIKHIGTGSQPPDMIIKENFGIQNKMSLYSCLYSEYDLHIANTSDSDLFIPIIKLINKLDMEIYSISVNIKNFDISMNETTQFDIFFTYGHETNPQFNFKKLDKIINPSNIVEIILENVINLGRLILNKPT